MSNLTNLGRSAQTNNLYVSNIYNENPSGTVTVNLPVAFVDNTIQKILFDTSGNLDTLGAFKLYSGTNLNSVYSSTSRYSIQLNSSNSFEIFDNVANDWRIRINSTTGIVSFNPAIGINTTATTSNTNYFPILVDTSGNQLNLTPYTSSTINYNPYLSQLIVPNINSSGTHYVGVLEATSGIGILNSAYLELNSSTFKRWLINCSADPTNNLGFAYYNGVFAVTLATLSQTGTFSTTNVSATTLISGPTMTATGTITGATLQATSQIQTFDTTGGLTANFTYITRATGITYIGSTVSGTPTNQVTITTAGLQNLVGTITSPNVTATNELRGLYIQATNNLSCFDTQAGLTTNYTYLLRTNGITYLGSTVSGSPTNKIIIDTAGATINGVIKGVTGQLWLYDTSLPANYVYLQYYATVFYAVIIYSGSPFTMYYCSNAVFVCNGTCYAPAFVISSCRNLKENIDDLCGDYCADFIKKLKPKRYNYKKVFDASGNETKPDIDKKVRFGFIAQDVEADLCHCENLGVYQEPKEKESAGINYIEIISPLVKVVQDLMIQQQFLMKEIELLKAQVKEKNESESLNEMIIKRIEMLELKVNV